MEENLVKTTSRLEKLNHHNNRNGLKCMKSYLKRQYVWEAVGGSETTAPSIEKDRMRMLIIRGLKPENSGIYHGNSMVASSTNYKENILVNLKTLAK